MPEKPPQIAFNQIVSALHGINSNETAPYKLKIGPYSLSSIPGYTRIHEAGPERYRAARNGYDAIRPET